MINFKVTYSGPSDSRIDLPVPMEIDSEIIRENGLVLSKNIHYTTTPLYIELLEENLHLQPDAILSISYEEITKETPTFEQFSFKFTDLANDSKTFILKYAPSAIRSITFRGLPLLEDEYTISANTITLGESITLLVGDIFDIKYLK